MSEYKRMGNPGFNPVSAPDYLPMENSGNFKRSVLPGSSGGHTKMCHFTANAWKTEI